MHICRYSKGFYRLAENPTKFEEKINQTLENEQPAWLEGLPHSIKNLK